MATGVTANPQYQHAIHKLEAIKRSSANNDDFWLAREVAPILGYKTWDKFLPVIKRAAASIAAHGGDPSHHIAQTSKMMEVGKGARRRADEFFLSRAACYLIAMNGDASKPEIAGAQAYFAIQTRRAELSLGGHQSKRLENRARVRRAAKRVADVAGDKGVKRFPLFHNARFEGLYEKSSRNVHLEKGVPDGQSPLDYAGPLELAAHAFQMELASEKLASDHTSGEEHAIQTNREVASSVRKTMIAEVGHGPEKLPLEREPIKVIERQMRKLNKPSR